MAKTFNSLFKITFVCLFVYQLIFILQLEISNYDGFSYMVAAKANAGFPYFLEPEINNRPPLLPLLLTPLALLHHWGVANKTIFTLQHLLALPMSYAFILAAYYFFRRTLREEYASLGALLIMIQPGFLAYAFEPMVDLPSAALLTLSVIIYLRHRKAPGNRSLFALCLVCGAGISLKNSLIIAPFIFACAETIILRLHEGKKWQEIIKARIVYLVPALSLGIYALVNIVANLPLHGLTAHNLSRIYQPFLSRATINAPFPLDPTANFSFMEVQMTLPWLCLMITGLFLCLRKKDPDTLTVWSWFVIFMGFIGIVNRMYQYRLLFPAMPACYFFSLSALQTFEDKAVRFWRGTRFFQFLRVAVLAVLLVLPAVALAQRLEFLNHPASNRDEMQAEQDPLWIVRVKPDEDGHSAVDILHKDMVRGTQTRRIRW
jgi:4-amino-4-deoxy-L-arabinose transferase-like glycosyltransferase